MEGLASLAGCRGFNPASVKPGAFTFTPCSEKAEKKAAKKEKKEDEKLPLPKRIHLKDFSLDFSTRLSGLNLSQAEFYYEHFKTDFAAWQLFL